MRVVGRPDDLARQYARMAGLAELDLHADSLEEVLRRIVDAVAELLPADRGASVLLWDRARQEFTEAASTLPDQDARRVAERIRGEDGASRFVVDHQEQVAVHDIEHDPFGANPLAIEFGIGAYAATPIVNDGVSVGVLYALATTPRHWSRDDLTFLATLAARAGAVIERTRLAEEAAYQRDRAELLSFVANALIGVADLDDVLTAIVSAVVAGIDADHVELRTGGWSDEGMTRVIVAPDRTVDAELVQALAAARARAVGAEYGQALGSAELSAEVGTAVGSGVVAPLRLRGRTIGYLTALRKAGSEDFTNEDAAMLSALASQAVVAIDNARLVEQTEEALLELSAVYEIVQAQNREIELEQMLSAIAEVVASALPASRVDIAVLGDGGFAQIVSGGRRRAPDPVASVTAFEEALTDGVPATSRIVPIDGGQRLVVPLRHRSRIVALALAERAGDEPPFDQRSLEMATVMGLQVAVVISNALLIEETKQLATTDSLTGVHNRRHLFELGRRVFAAAKRYDRPLAVIMFDIDHFKVVNDTYGHGVGDEVLHAVADRAGQVIRAVDILGRYGGEEFIVLLPETDEERAVRAAERIREAIGTRSIETAAGPMSVTISAGVAAFDPSMEDLNDLIEAADRAMYRAKHAGRNCTVGAGMAASEDGAAADAPSLSPTGPEGLPVR